MSATHPRQWHLVRKERPHARGGYTLQIVDTNGLVVIHGMELAREETLAFIVRAVNESEHEP